MRARAPRRTRRWQRAARWMRVHARPPRSSPQERLSNRPPYRACKQEPHDTWSAGHGRAGCGSAGCGLPECWAASRCAGARVTGVTLSAHATLPVTPKKLVSKHGQATTNNVEIALWRQGGLHHARAS
eukprot:12274-Chlamydomonas_euryale.AAC.1